MTNYSDGRAQLRADALKTARDALSPQPLLPPEPEPEPEHLTSDKQTFLAALAEHGFTPRNAA